MWAEEPAFASGQLLAGLGDGDGFGTGGTCGYGGDTGWPWSGGGCGPSGGDTGGSGGGESCGAIVKVAVLDTRFFPSELFADKVAVYTPGETGLPFPSRPFHIAEGLGPVPAKVCPATMIVQVTGKLHVFWIEPSREISLPTGPLFVEKLVIVSAFTISTFTILMSVQMLQQLFTVSTAG